MHLLCLIVIDIFAKFSALKILFHVTIRAHTLHTLLNYSEQHMVETGRRLGDRFREHLRDVEKDDKNASKPVTRHFNLPNHSKQHMVGNQGSPLLKKPSFPQISIRSWSARAFHFVNSWCSVGKKNYIFLHFTFDKSQEVSEDEMGRTKCAQTLES